MELFSVFLRRVNSIWLALKKVMRFLARTWEGVFFFLTLFSEEIFLRLDYVFPIDNVNKSTSE